jgi:hypothetical protein
MEMATVTSSLKVTTDTPAYQLLFRSRTEANARSARFGPLLSVAHLQPKAMFQDKMTDSARTIIGRVVSKYTLAYARAMAWGGNRWGRVVRSQQRLIRGENPSADLRVFQLLRDEDPSGVSGVGRVAIGVVFPSGKLVLEWFGSQNTLGIYDDLRRVEHIHGHGGKTRIVFTTRAPIPYRTLLVRTKASPKAHHTVGE